MSESDAGKESNPELKSSFYMDFKHPSMIQFIRENCSQTATAEHKAIELYYAVRDLIRYDPYTYSFDKETFKASSIIESGRAWCVPKAILYTSCCRAIGLRATLGFADVRNHLSTQRMRDSMKTDVFYWHGYTNVFLYSKWVKATPAFNIELCKKFKLKPLDFDGTSDSMYHPFDKSGNKHMEYINDRGTYLIFPFTEMVSDLRQLYTHHVPNDADFDVDVEAEIN